MPESNLPIPSQKDTFEAVESFVYLIKKNTGPVVMTSVGAVMLISSTAAILTPGLVKDPNKNGLIIFILIIGALLMLFGVSARIYALRENEKLRHELLKTFSEERNKQLEVFMKGNNTSDGDNGGDGGGIAG